jgi:multidrug transporter EmrE-like cation transporter
MGWFWLGFTVTTDVAATITLAYTGGRFEILPAILAIIGYSLSFIGLWQAMRRIDVAVVYALWSAIGTAVIAVLGVALFGQTMPPARIGWLVVILVGVAGLQMSASRPEAATADPVDPPAVVYSHPLLRDFGVSLDLASSVKIVQPRSVPIFRSEPDGSDESRGEAGALA